MRTPFVLKAVLASLALFLVAVPAGAQTGAQQPDERIPITTEIRVPVPDPSTVPGSTAERRLQYLTEGRVEDLAQYIGIVYNFLISIVGVVAAVAMIIGGFQYLTSAGDSGKIGQAKSKITNALIGLILALGAYTILNTINPALLTLQLPDLRPVRTQIFLMPWCETLIAAGETVTQVGVDKECGYVGSYVRGGGSAASKQYCIYSGTCRVRRDSVDTVDIGEEPDDSEKNGMYANCTQFANLDNATIAEKVATNPNIQLGKCLYCAQITRKMAEDLGYGMPSACEAWAKSFESLKPKTFTYEGYTFENGFFHYCGAADSDKYCVGAAINCMSATRNEDDSFSDYVSNGCEGYDEDPSPSWPRSIDSKGYATGRYNYDEEGLEDYPDHLGGVCFPNPCKDFRDPASGLTPFASGCKSGNGTLYTARRVMSKGDFSPDDCRNK